MTKPMKNVNDEREWTMAKLYVENFLKMSFQVFSWFDGHEYNKNHFSDF